MKNLAKYLIGIALVVAAFAAKPEWIARAQTGVLNYISPTDSTGDNAYHMGGSFYLGPTRAQTVAVTLTNAQVLALNSTPVTIVAAPGAGKFVDVIGVTVAFHYVGAYTGGTNLKLFWGSRQAGNAASSVITVSGLLVSVSADTIVRVGGTPDGTNPPTTSLALVLEMMGNSAFGGGNASNTVTITVEYRIVTTGL